MLEALQAWDEGLFLAINGNLSSPIVDAIMKALSGLGEGLSLGLILLACAFIGDRRGLRGRVAFVALGVLSGAVVVNVVKPAVARPRPGGAFEARIQAGLVKVHFVGAPPRGNTSFPSGHSQGAFGAALVLGELFRRLRWPFLAGAALIALSRICVGAHFPIDVLTGSLIGILCASAAIYLRRRQLARVDAIVPQAAQ